MSLFKTVAVILLSAISVGAQNAAPLTLKKIQSMIDTISQGFSKEIELLNSIRTYGVQFQWTSDNQRALRSMGATQAVLDAVARVAPKPPSGTLNVHCTPGDCMVAVNGADSEPSKEGQFSAEMQTGNITVEVSKEGYLPQQLKADIRSGAPSEINATLVPTEETKVANGKKLLDLIISELGLEGNSKKLSSWTAKGNMTVRSGDKLSELSFDLAAQPLAFLDMRAYNAKNEALTLACDGEACGPPGKNWFKTLGRGGKKLPKELEPEVDAVLRGFARYSLTAVLRALDSSGVKLTASSAEPKGSKDQKLKAAAGDQVYELTFGADLLPTNVEYSSSMASAVSVAYASYEDIGNGARYPRRTTVRWADQKRSLEVNLNKPEPISGK